MADLYRLWRRAERPPGGRALFTRAVCWKAPYFGSIRPQIDEFSPERCVTRMAKRRAVTSHIGTVHAIAMCNLAEVAAGMLAEVSVPAPSRWIPKGMQVRYVAKAETDVHATAVAEKPGAVSEDGIDYPIVANIEDSRGETVVVAVITMWITHRRY